MATLFVIKGINPGTGKVVQLTIVAESADAARHQAEEAGLEKVTVRPADPPDAPKG